MLYLLVFLVPFLYLFHLGAFQVWSPNEAFYADGARNMLSTGDFINPYYNGEPRLNKPPMTYWLVSLGFLLFGLKEWGLRFMHALLGLGTGVLTAIVAYELTKDRKVALLSFLSLTLSMQFFANSQYASPEVPFTFFITLSLTLWLFYYRRRLGFLLPLAFLSSSSAMLVKGPVGFILPAGVVFLYLLLTDPRELLKLRYYLLSLLALILGLWWHAYQLITKGNLFWQVFYSEHFARLHKEKAPFYYYLIDLNVSFLPYSFLFFFALLWLLFKFKREYIFVLVWSGFIYGFFSLVGQKIPVYVLPAFPALAVITSGFLFSEDFQPLKKYASLFITTLVLLIIVFAVLFFKQPLYLFALVLLPLFAFFKDYRLSPAVAGFVFVAVLKLFLLPQLEEKRHFRELGTFIKSLDPEAKLPTYQVGHFHHSLPFYAERRIIRDQIPKKGSLVVFKRGSFEGCEPVRTFRLYTGSESRLFIYLRDSLKDRGFEEFGVCLY